MSTPSFKERALYGWFAPMKNQNAKTLLAALAWTLTLRNVLRFMEDVQDSPWLR